MKVKVMLVKIQFLNEIGGEEEEVDDEVMEDDRTTTATGSGRRILRRFDNDWLYY